MFGDFDVQSLWIIEIYIICRIDVEHIVIVTGAISFFLERITQNNISIDFID